MLGVYYTMARIIITKYAHEFKSCEMFRVLSNHERALFGEKIARFGISRFYVIIVLHQSQMIVDIVKFTSHESFSVI